LSRLHETSIVPAHIACHALAFFALARMLDKPKSGAVLLAVALAGAFFSRAWPGLIPILFALLFAIHPRSGLWQKRHYILGAIVIASAIITTWWTLATRADLSWIETWRHWNSTRLGLPEFEVAMRPLRDLPWFLWPIWPLAMLALWQWRRWITAPHIWLPLAFLLGVLLTLPVLQEPGEPEYVLFAIPLAALAAFALPTMRRGVINALDWFALMCFSVTIVCVWVGWFALHFGIPRQISLNIARLTVGYEPQLLWWPVLAAAMVTLCWIALVIWRLRLRPTVLWRGSLLCASGLTLTWVLLVLLWLPPLDYVRSYRPMSAQVKQALALAVAESGLPSCMRAQGLSLGPRASLYVFDGINFTYDSRCPFVLQQTTLKRITDGSAGYSDVATVLWQGSRGADRYDRYRLLRISTQ
jgi:4-amino-4-deoxy-L-arabinose transferase-like glycosyltransferase